MRGVRHGISALHTRRIGASSSKNACGWLKKPGDDVVGVVETQKGAIEIEIFETGVLDRILVQPGEQVPVGTRTPRRTRFFGPIEA